MMRRLMAWILAMLMLFSGAAALEDSTTTEESPIASRIIMDFGDLAGISVSVQTGMISDQQAKAVIPDVEIQYFENQVDCMMALKNGKVDAWCTDDTTYRYFEAEDPELTYLGYIDIIALGALFPKTEQGRALRDQYSAFIKRLWADGTMDEVDGVWFGPDEFRTMPDYSNLPAPNGTLRMALDNTLPPFAYTKDDRIIGYDVDVAYRFCLEYGYGLEIVPMSFGAVIPAVVSGKCDFASSAVTITEERSESVYFSYPNYFGGTVLAVRTDSWLLGDAALPRSVYRSVDDLADKMIGVETGTSFDASVLKRFPGKELQYFNSKADLVNALVTGKIEAYVTDEPVIKAQMYENDDLTYLPEYLDTFEFGFVFPKTGEGEALRDEFSSFVRELRDDGTLREMEKKWLSIDMTVKTLPDYRSFPAPNGTLRLATEALYQPFSYILRGEPVGYDLDLAARFCEAYGYGLEIVDMNFSSVLPAVTGGKCDFGAAGITITDERKESVLFSEPNYSGGVVLVTLREQPEEEGFWEGIRSSFNKTFIREDRWQMFLEGIGNTLLITVLAVLFGTAAGFGVFLLCRKGRKIPNLITHGCAWMVQGTPAVVLLMVLYYVVFGSSTISAMGVAVIGFSLIFAAAVIGMLRIGVGTVDKGQYEAAGALGYSDSKTFFRFILPQAIPHVMPAFRSEVVSLIKATAIVGYISVQDLTKMGDIIRSRTYEAFFPLIAVTVIYFVLEAVLIRLIRLIPVDSRRRKTDKILKGVNRHDPD